MKGSPEQRGEKWANASMSRRPFIKAFGKMALNDLVFLAKFSYIIITSNGDVLVNGINIDDFA